MQIIDIELGYEIEKDVFSSFHMRGMIYVYLLYLYNISELIKKALTPAHVVMYKENGCLINVFGLCFSHHDSQLDNLLYIFTIIYTEKEPFVINKAIAVELQN